MKDAKTININDLEGFEIISNYSMMDRHDKEITEINRKIDTLDSLFADYLKTQNTLTDYIAKSQAHVNSYVAQQLHNQAIFQIFVEREIFLNNLHADMIRAEVMAVAELPWWKKNKKNIELAKSSVEAYFKSKKDASLQEFDKRAVEEMKAYFKERDIKDECDRVQE